MTLETKHISQDAGQQQSCSLRDEEMGPTPLVGMLQPVQPSSLRTIHFGLQRPHEFEVDDKKRKKIKNVEQSDQSFPKARNTQTSKLRLSHITFRVPLKFAGTRGNIYGLVWVCWLSKFMTSFSVETRRALAST
jgi:hypothetical protein